MTRYRISFRKCKLLGDQMGGFLSMLSGSLTSLLDGYLLLPSSSGSVKIPIGAW